MYNRIRSHTFVAMNKFILNILFIFAAAPLYAVDEPSIDTMINVESINVTVIKQGLNLYRQPVASTVLSQEMVENERIESIGDVAELVPNLHIPEYGSRMTSSIYIRGLGARIDQPVMGLNIDNVPFLNKNAFDLDVMDIERLEVLRGPQSTLYGRNTMGGVMNIYTLSPASYQGIRIGAEYSSGNTYKLNLSSYQRHGEKWASAITLYGNSTDGLFENSYTGEMCDWERSLGGRVKVNFAPSQKLRIENTLAASWLDQGGYAYKLIDAESVSYNSPSGYERVSVSNGTTIKYRGDKFTFSSITGYQYLDDKMTLDNDFTDASYFTLSQAIKENSISEDLVMKSNNTTGYNSLFGLFGFYKNQNMVAPVTFLDYGIDQLILANANPYFAPYEYVWDEDSFLLGSDFSVATYGAALYHESTYEKGRWRVSAGVRFDYEVAKLEYHNYTNTSATCYDPSGGVVTERVIDIDLRDKSSLSFFEILPRVTALYRVGSYNQSTLYATIAKGYKAGGYNTQMFSDILQQKVMKEFGVTMGEEYTIEKVISYDPEYSWNYEVGGHFESSDRRIMHDFSLFYIDVRNQQLTVFPEGQTTGRMMTNAGRSRSYGAEMAIRYRPSQDWAANLAYGYTNAKFIDYTSGNDDYAGNHVPYSPQHTLSGSVNYTWKVGSGLIEAVVFEVGSRALGKIYWNEENTRSQPLYALLDSSVRLEMGKVDLSFWGRNLTNTEYSQFYFMSIGNEFVQCGKPRTMGVRVNINL